MIGQAPPRTRDHVAVLMGGWSAEREISLWFPELSSA